MTVAVLARAEPAALQAATASCAHCGLPAPPGQQFCCTGCGVAFDLILGLGLGRYYTERLLDPARRAPKPEVSDHPDPARPDLARPDMARYVTQAGDGTWEVTLAVDGLHCGACVWLIESILGTEPALLRGRVNMTTRRLHLAWRGDPTTTAADAAMEAARYVALIEALGYRLVPFTPAALAAARNASDRFLLRCLAVAGFAAGNGMFIALGTWAGAGQGTGLGAASGMGLATRDLLHWIGALIALPAIAYAGRPFFGSAWAALRHGRTNMDVPISLGVLLVTGLSLWQTAMGGDQTYFESATMLLFFLLVGRVLDHRARGRARAAAEDLLTLRHTDVGVLTPSGAVIRRPQHDIVPGDLIITGMGERLGADGVVQDGASTLDASLVTGESLPITVQPGAQVFAGTLNLGAPLTVRVTAAGAGTMLAECVRLIEAAEAVRGRYVVLADRVARAYAPVVHLCALLTFLAWVFAWGAPVGQALLAACAVLIITCPCALALAVPAVQVIATGRLFASGVLLKSATALERVAEATVICFDKTGTLTEPELRLDGVPDADADADALHAAAAIAGSSRHPLARALCAATGPVAVAASVTEHPGQGLTCGTDRLGSASFCGISGQDDSGQDESGTSLWLTRPGLAPVQFRFTEHLRIDAGTTIGRLRAMGLDVRLLSGDHAAPVAAVAAALGITNWRAGQRPADKVAAITAWQAAGDRVMMVGDGLNDGPALSAASVSASPSTAADISQTVADMVFQGRKLAPVALAVATGRRARRVMRQNLVLALGYNVVAAPLAMAGLVTPWIAAAAMSASSLLVMANSARVRGGRGTS